MTTPKFHKFLKVYSEPGQPNHDIYIMLIDLNTISCVEAYIEYKEESSSTSSFLSTTTKSIKATYDPTTMLINLNNGGRHRVRATMAEMYDLLM